MNRVKQNIAIELEDEILDAKKQIKIRPTEIIVTIIALVAGVILFCFNLTSLLGLSLILFGALWNFFTESNRFFACIGAFFMCIVYGFVAGSLNVYGHAFLHLMFYLPTQLIYYYESNRQDNSISHEKGLTQTGYIGTVFCGWLVAFGLGIVLFKVGDPYYIIDAISTTLLIVSVFLVNGKYKEYYPVRIIALLCAVLMWVIVGIKTSFNNDSSIFIVLFSMYLVMDAIKFFRWKNAK